MKKLLFSLLFLVMTTLSINVKADPVSLATGYGLGLAVAYYAVHYNKPLPACVSGPTRLVAWQDNPKGYTFNSEACDFNPNTMIIIAG